MRVLNERELSLIDRSLPISFAGVRTRVVIALALNAIKESEIVRLNMEDLTTFGQSSQRRCDIRIGEDVVPGGDVGRYMDHYFEGVRLFAPEAIDQGRPLIISLAADRLTGRSIRKDLKTASTRSGVEFVFHDLHATAIKHVWDVTESIEKVTKWCRIKTSSTLMRHLVDTGLIK